MQELFRGHHFLHCRYPNKSSAVLYPSLCGPSKTPWTQTLLLPYLSGIVLGSLYYGYPMLQIAGGWLSLKLGGTKIFGCGVFLASLLTIFTAPAARYSVYALIALRAGEGLFLVTNTRRQLYIPFLINGGFCMETRLVCFSVKTKKRPQDKIGHNLATLVRKK